MASDDPPAARRHELPETGTVKVFVASPGDVQAERLVARSVIQQLDVSFRRERGVRVTDWLWENDAPPGLGEPQEIINPDLDSSDIVVAIFGESLGTRTSRGPSGTEEEVLRAIDRWDSDGSPHVMLYFRELGDAPSADGDERLTERERFRRELPPNLQQTYTTPDTFREKLYRHLDETVRRLLAERAAAAGGPGPGQRPTEASRRYADWLRDTTARFRVPGLAALQPVHAVSFQLRRLEGGRAEAPADLRTEFERYREWGRRAWTTSQTRLSPADVLRESRHSVIVGGPGSGKSTLAQQLAHTLVEQQPQTLRVRLRDVSQLRGLPFGEALVVLASSGSSLSEAAALDLLRTPTVLIADGLDECFPDRLPIAEQLARWAAGHPDCRVLVTTRGVGHDESLLPGWDHYELPPLGKDGARRCAETLLVGQGLSPERAARAREAFESVLDQEHVAALASHSPLLVAFLLALILRGHEVGRTRAELYGRVLGKLRLAERSGRPLEDVTPTVRDERFLDALGWQVQCDPAQPLDRLLERTLAGPPDSRADDAALAAHERSFRFWEQRGVVERLAVDEQQTAAFVHMAFQEYTAGRHLSQLPDAEARAVVARRRRDPAWREVLVLSAAEEASRLVRELLALDDPQDPTSTEAVLAAAALAESAAVAPGLSERVARALADRLTSPAPTIALEGASALLDLLDRESDLIGRLGSQLISHAQPWSHGIGLTLSAVAGVDHADLDALEADLRRSRELLTPPRAAGGIVALGPGQPWSRLVDELLIRAADLLCSERPGESTRSLLQGILEEGLLSSEQTRRIRAAAARHGLDLQATSFELRSAEIMAGFLRVRHTEQDEALLAAIQHALSAGQAPTESAQPLRDLALLVEALGVWSQALPDYRRLADGADSDGLHVVVRGVTTAAGLDPGAVLADVQDALELLAEGDIDLVRMLPNAQPTIDWAAGAAADLPADALAEALDHDQPFVVNSAGELVEAGAGGDALAGPVAERLGSYGEHGLAASAALAETLWGRAAAATLLARMRGSLSPGCEHVLERLPDLAEPSQEEEVRQILLRALRDGPARAVAGAARGLAKSPRREGLGPELRTAFEAWIQREPPYPAAGGVIPFSPREDIFRAGVQHGGFSRERLAELCTDKRVGSDAVRALAQSVKGDREGLRQVLEQVRGNPDLARVLGEMGREVPEDLSQDREALVPLLSSPHAAVRRAATRLLAVPGVRGPHSADLARERLTDSDPETRDAAVRALRALAEE